MKIQYQRIAGIILAAGNSTRMGKPKALLNIGKSTFLEEIVRNLLDASFAPLIIVLGTEEAKIKNALIDDHHCVFVHNKHPEKGQISSLHCALKKLPDDVLGCLMVLVDHPLVKASTYHAFYTQGQKTPDKIVIPTYNSKRGHPVYFGRRYFTDLLEAPLSLGARAVVEKNTQGIHLMAMEDAGILKDIDTPADYHTFLK
jgi:molybdenum cofactor cytidylyltransferase